MVHFGVYSGPSLGTIFGLRWYHEIPLFDLGIWTLGNRSYRLAIYLSLTIGCNYCFLYFLWYIFGRLQLQFPCRVAMDLRQNFHTTCAPAARAPLDPLDDVVGILYVYVCCGYLHCLHYLLQFAGPLAKSMLDPWLPTILVYNWHVNSTSDVIPRWYPQWPLFLF